MKRYILAKGKAFSKRVIASQPLRFTRVRGILSGQVQTKGELDGKDTAAPMKKLNMTKAFSMIELIFVIILISVLAGIGSAFIPSYTLINDTNFVLQKLQEKQKNAINYDTNNFDGSSAWKNHIVDSFDYNQTCLKLEKDSLNTIENSSNSQKKYEIKSIIGVPFSSKILCFDFLGRPYVYGALQLLPDSVDINISKNSAEYNTISVYPISGYAKIK